MTIVAKETVKRPYTPPTLTSYGTMVSLTRNGPGSRPENKKSRSKNKRV